MIVRQYAPCNLGRNTICLGKQGEINALRVEFDVSVWMAMYPEASVKLMHFAPDRPQDNPVIPTLGVEGTTRVWIVGEDDTANAGNGVIELLLIDERTGSTIKSATGYTTVLHSPSAGIETQEAEAGYVRYDIDQSALLTDEQKAVARKNIGAGTGEGTGSGTGGITVEKDPTVPDWAKQPSKPTYTAGEVGARPDSWTPSASDVGADAAGTALAQVGAHNVSGAAHADLRALIDGLTIRLNALADSDDETLDQLSEIVAYIKSNKALIDAVTTGKVSTSDIVDNLTTNASDKVLSAAQGVKLKALIDAIIIPDKLPNPQPLTINGQSYDGSTAVEVTVTGEGAGVEVDATLTQSGKAADAKVVGDKLSELNEANVKQDERLTTMENASGISAPLLGSLTRTAIYPCSTIYLDGDTTDMTKDVSVVLDILITDEYGNEFFRGKSETSWQGSGSLSYPNKNLSLKLQDAAGEKAKISVFPDYATHAYHLKCNYLDYSMVRNSVGAQLAHDFDDTVFPVDAPITVKSIPVIVYLNGAFNGCYTLNYKQDDKLFGMDSETNPLTEIVYRSGLGTWTQSNFEYRGDADETADMQAKLQTMMDFAANSDDETFTAEFENHFDLNNAINYWLYADIACATDSMINNWTVATWDGAKWYMCWYDLDIIFGLMENAGNATHPNAPDTDLLSLTYTTNNPIWAKLYRCFYDRIRTRYWELREGIANPTKLVSRFRTFQSKWGADNIAKERAKWTARPNTSADVDDMYAWMTERFAVLDAKYTIAEEIPCTGITLDQTELTFDGAGAQTLTATVTPSDTTDTVVWSSDNSSIASVNGGVVTAKANGSATITATCGDYSATCIVSVSGIEAGGVTDGLPTGYTRLSYIESNGTQYINTGAEFPFASDDEFYMRFAITDTSKTQVLYGYGDDDTNNQIAVVNGKFRIDPVSMSTNTDAIVLNNKYEYVVRANTITIHGKTYTMGTLNQNGILYLLAKNMDSSPNAPAYARLYEMHYKTAGELTMHLVPVLDASGVPGLYDTVSGRTLYNAGTGEFAYEVYFDIDYTPTEYEQVEYIMSDGTQQLRTGVNASDSMRIIADLGIPTTSYETIFGAVDTSDSQDFRTMYTGNTNTVYCDVGNDRLTVTGMTKGNFAGYRNVIEIGNHYLKLTSADGLYEPKAVTGTTQTADAIASNEIVLFGRDSSIAAQNDKRVANLKVYSFVIYDGEEKVRDFIPVLTYQGVAGLYDLITRRLYAHDDSSIDNAYTYG
ncbi:MAG: CotH kinase family protein [Candidatus Ventricola sp.]